MAYDVMQAVAPGRYVHRTVHYAFMWAYFWYGAFRLQRQMLAAEGLWSPALLWHHREWLFGLQGILATAAPDMLHYLRPGYHPAHLRVPEGPYAEWSRKLSWSKP